MIKQQPKKLNKVVVLNAPHGLEGGVKAYERVTGKNYNWTQDSRKHALKTDLGILKIGALI